MAQIKKDKSTPEKIAFWTSAEAALDEIRNWPPWKQNYVPSLLLRRTVKKTTEPVRHSKKKK
jgi:hypothetical protein